jgi:hypothetical protein
MQITTNYVPRPVIYGYELTEEQRKEFDYLNWQKIEAGEDSADFFEYKGELYDLGEFMASSMFPEWDGYTSDTYFSGLLIKFVENFESVIVGRYCA